MSKGPKVFRGSTNRHRRADCSLVLFLLISCCCATLRADDLEDCAREFQSGNYKECVESANQAIQAGRRQEEWRIWHIRSLIAIGSYPEAKVALDAALGNSPSTVRLRLLGYDVYRRNGDVERADRMLQEINQLAGRTPGRFSDPADRVALGRAALLLGAEPRQVLEVFYDRVKKEHPKLRDVYLATGELALNKHDYGVAARAYQDGLEHFPHDADMHFGLAQAFAPSDDRQAAQALAKALEFNPNHVSAILFAADQLIDSERYDEAAKRLEYALTVDPRNPESWAYRAVLAHLRGDSSIEQECRAEALQSWKTNPAVDHLIGRKLSQKYRFAEGSASQRQALTFDAGFLPAKIQLAQDLLRLGQEAEGWQHAEEVHQRDRYDVVAYNLVTLRDNIAKFRTVRDDAFIVRMDPREADLYGDRVVDLLRRVRQCLCEKYGLELKEAVSVEIFTQQSDFAVRTFGMPGGAGFLGVCFGKVITANSPASQGAHPANWESVLWHEFCHVVTLELTHNKMPRWLSEGISVYEERAANRAWGQTMNPKYREMILSGGLTPVGRLSGAFLAPPTPSHLQFAYFESSLVVEFLVEQHGFETLRGVLQDLAKDVPINDALESHTGKPIAELERSFERFAREQAERLAPDADLDRDKLPKPQAGDATLLSRWLDQHPNNFWGLLEHAASLIQQRKWNEAKVPLERAIQLFPGYTGPDNAYTMLASTHRELNEPDAERATLEMLVQLVADNVQGLLRLLELTAEAKDWPNVVRQAEALLAVNPLLLQPHRGVARAADELGQPEPAIRAYRRLLLMEPADLAEVHYRLAWLLHQTGDATAKRHVLMALEEAPRFQEALELLLKINRANAR